MTVNAVSEHEDDLDVMTFLEKQFEDVLRPSPSLVQYGDKAWNHILRVTGASDETTLQSSALISWVDRSLAGHPMCDIPQPLASSTIIGYAKRAHLDYRERLGLDSPFTDEIWEHIFAMCAKYGRPEVPVMPATRDVVRALLNVLDPTIPWHICLASFITLDYSTMQRASEVLALDNGDAAAHPRGALVRFGKAKNNPECLETYIPVPYDEERALCPVRRLNDWRAFRGTSDGPLYRTMEKDKKHLSDRRLGVVTLRKQLVKIAARAGLSLHPFGPSAFRRGGVTDGTAQRRSEAFMKRRTRHRSFVFWRYIDTTAMDDTDYVNALVLP